MTCFVMIHGGAHGSWCWQPLLGLVDAPMLALDLPGRGRHPAALEAQSFASFVDSAAADIMGNDLQDIVLVSHSMGGLTAIGLMERIPERLRHVVFCASPVPPDGTSVGEYMQKRVERSAVRLEAERALDDGNANAGIADMLFRDLTPADRGWCLARISPESMAVYNEPVRLTRLGSAIPRTYIRTLLDRGLPPDLQDDSIGRIGRTRVVAMHNGHTAMVADPKRFGELIEEAAR